MKYNRDNKILLSLFFVRKYNSQYILFKKIMRSFELIEFSDVMNRILISKDKTDRIF